MGIFSAGNNAKLLEQPNKDATHTNAHEVYFQLRRMNNPCQAGVVDNLALC
jgi:hypothetical protein